MNKQELQGAFSKIHASNALVKEVLSVEKEKRKLHFGWKRTVRLATVAAVVAAILIGALAFWPAGSDPETPQIIAMPGVMKVYAYENERQEEVEITESQNLGLAVGFNATNAIWSPYMSLTNGVRMTLQILNQDMQEHEITFDISTNYGELYAEGASANIDPNLTTILSHGKTVTINNGDWFRWEGQELVEMCVDRTMVEVLEQTGQIYTEVIIRADGNIVGYAVFEILCLNPDMATFGIAMRESVYYPKVDGQFQEVSEAYVQEQIKARERNNLPDESRAKGGVFHSPRGSHESVDIIYASVCRGIRYTCYVFDARYADCEITFDVRADGGWFWSDSEKYGSEFSVGNNTSFYWRGGGLPVEETNDPIYVDVIIRADGQVIGYAVIRIGYAYSVDPETGEKVSVMGYAADSCFSVCYPPVDGQLPDLTEEEARAEIEAYKQSLKAQDSVGE